MSTTVERIKVLTQRAVETGAVSLEDAADMLNTGRVSQAAYNAVQAAAERDASVSAAALEISGKMFGGPLEAELQAHSTALDDRQAAANALWGAVQEIYREQGLAPPEAKGLGALFRRAFLGAMHLVTGNLPPSRETYAGGKVAEKFIENLGSPQAMHALLTQLKHTEAGRAGALPPGVAVRSNAELMGDVKRMLGFAANAPITLQDGSAPYGSGNQDHLHLQYATAAGPQRVGVSLASGAMEFIPGDNLKYAAGMEYIRMHMSK